MSVPAAAAVAAAAAADNESSSSGESSESDGASDAGSIIAHPGASATNFESSILQVYVIRTVD
jgi:hypothetical protein